MRAKRPVRQLLLKGGAILALPFLLASGFLRAGNEMPTTFSGLSHSGTISGGAKGSIEGSWMALSVNHDALNEASAQAGFPGTSASMIQMIGGGAMVQKGQTRYGAMGMTGSLASDSGSGASNWGLDIVGLMAEQRYPGSSWEVTAGFFAGYGQFSVEYRDPGYSRFESRFVCSGGTAGIRWPTDTTISFFLRSGYLWIPAQGSWHGSVAGKMAKTYFDLSAPFGQGGLDIVF